MLRPNPPILPSPKNIKQQQAYNMLKFFVDYYDGLMQHPKLTIEAWITMIKGKECHATVVIRRSRTMSQHIHLAVDIGHNNISVWGTCGLRNYKLDQLGMVYHMLSHIDLHIFVNA